jgi:hypothetical protein
MEDLLLVLDEIDDAVAVIRMFASRFLGFVVACGLFAATIMAAIHWPLLAALLVFSAVIWATMPVTGGIKPPRLKTDP